MPKKLPIWIAALAAVLFAPTAFAVKTLEQCQSEITYEDQNVTSLRKCLLDSLPKEDPDAPEKKLKPFRSTMSGHRKAVAASTRAVRDELKDPESATFKNLTSNRNFTVCGEVNAKNSYGGYIGFKRFVAVGTVVFMEEATPGFPDMWETSCAKNMQPK